MKKLLLVAASLIAVSFSFAKTVQAAQVASLDFDVATQPSPLVEPASKAESPVELSFDPPSQPVKAEAEVEPLPDAPTPDRSPSASFLPKASTSRTAFVNDTDELFDGGSDSLVAKTVGHAEGTRTVDGKRTRAYYGHVDPGNRAWNIGSFSYQHCDARCTPEEADDRQLRRLRNQTEILQQKAVSYGMQMSLEEQLNGIDLANQAPLAALDQGGYIDRLRSAHQRGFTGSEAVLWARTYSFMNPRTQTWEAPGLGNTYDSISHDQERRRQAIVRALAHETSIRSNIASSTLP